jgi:hypothetical protein
MKYLLIDMMPIDQALANFLPKGMGGIQLEYSFYRNLYSVLTYLTS